MPRVWIPSQDRFAVESSNMRPFCSSLLSICIVLAWVFPNFANGQEASESSGSIQELISYYCSDCHSGEGSEGGIDLDFLVQEGQEVSLADDIETVEKIIRVLNEQQMPPADSEQPNSSERVQLLEWIQSQLDSFDCGDISRPGRVTVRRLNRVEYDNTIRDLTGLDLKLAKSFPSDDVGNGFDNIGDVLTIPPILMEKYIGAAIEIAEKVTADPESLKTVFPFQPKDPKNIGEVFRSARESVNDFVRRAYRRPPTPEEQERYVELMRKGFEQGLSTEQIQHTIIAATLSSPQFIYKLEIDNPSDFISGIRPLNDFEIATRLSYFLWSSTPDRELLDRAEAGELSTTQQIESEVERMLNSPKATALVKNFAGQWLQLRDLENLSPDPNLFGDFDNDLREAMRKESELLFESLVRENSSILDLLNADYTFVNQRLAEFYGLEDVQGHAFQRVTLGGLRSGLLMHASVLLITSNPTRTSPVKRGKWILDNLLGEPPPPPPPDVPELGESGETLGTLRQQMEQHRENPNCAVCHTKMDALGFGLENFDAIGQWRKTDGKDTIDPSGELPGGREFQGPVELVKILAEDKKAEFTKCMTRKMLTYALGRGLGVQDRCTVNTIVALVEADEYRMRSLVKAIATSEPFRFQESAD